MNKRSKPKTIEGKYKGRNSRLKNKRVCVTECATDKSKTTIKAKINGLL
jgi:hypothetical protein